MKRGLLLVAAALVVAGIAVIVSAVSAQKKASRADNWDQKRGVVERVQGGNVAYRYDAGGTTHRGSAPGHPRVTYTAGKRVLVYVNPAAPAESVLELPVRPPNWPIAAGAVTMLIGAGLGVGASQMEKKPSLPAGKKPTKVPGDTTTRRKSPPLARLKPPPPAPWKRGEGENSNGDQTP